MNTRRILLIASIVVVLLGVGIGLYFFLTASNAGIATTQGGATSLPIAGQGTAGNASTNGSAAQQSGSPVIISPRLVQISSGPVVVGEVVVDRDFGNASSTPEVDVNFIERQSGNVYSYVATSKTLTRTSNKTVPGIQSAAWLQDGSTAFVRYLSGTDFSVTNTYALSATGTEGFFLPQNLSDIAVSSTSILALASGVNGSTASLAHSDGTKSSVVFSTPLSSLRVGFAGVSQYLAFTKPTATLPGYAFLIDGTGHFVRVAGPLNGLVALSSHNGKYVLISYTLNSDLHLELVNAATGETILLPVGTVADKCVWTADDTAIYCGIPLYPPSGAYPDDWYQGATHFSDRIWKIDVANRVAQLELDFSSATKDAVDVSSLAIDPHSTTLVFINKNDGSLWSYSL